MRVMVTINGKVSVHEILEFEPQEMSNSGVFQRNSAADGITGGT